MRAIEVYHAARRAAPAPRTYDASPDGQRPITIAPVKQDAEEASPKIRMVENRYEEFGKRE